MKLKPIRDEAEYRSALHELSVFFDSDPDAACGEVADYFEVLATLVSAYEEENYPIDAPDPIEAIKFRMDQMDMEIKDLDTIIGKPNRVYEVFSKKRPLTLNMIRRIREKMGISADILIGNENDQPKSERIYTG